MDGRLIRINSTGQEIWRDKRIDRRRCGKFVRCRTFSLRPPALSGRAGTYFGKCR
ncbi:hypothetical protein GCWU000341_01969 [Oribacterium sp. oral taxon 078 str. F0262]|nr:hypothetical protein GCWU000341_01969 [Oribacterium sp. oral taxon 078 str. F0262]